MRRLAIALIRCYQRLISPWLGEHCRFYPTCSCYAVTALEEHGFFSGTWLALRRLLKCHPLHPGGLDPVPPAKSERRARGTRPSTLPLSKSVNMGTGGRSSATPQFCRL